MKNLLLLIFLFLSQISLAQNKAPLKKLWDYRFGGADEDYFTTFLQTGDGGYLLGGFSQSNAGGDKTQNVVGPMYDWDFWIVKIDSLGNKQWDKDYGGTKFDDLWTMQQTRDGGYILGGYSNSEISGDKSQNLQGDSTDQDYWIIKIDSLGNKQWDKDFGGTADDLLYSIMQTKDGGYIMGGSSRSGAGGDKTQNLKGIEDYWIIKTDSLGNKQWDKDFGGTGSNAFSWLGPTRDGGYILGGYSSSGIGADKTQNTNGQEDYWVIKIDSLGNKQWDKDFGGSIINHLFYLQQIADGGYILGGVSNSGISGDKTQTNWDTSLHSFDYWVVKTDSLGNKQWDKDYGGVMSEDVLNDIHPVAGGNYLLGGISFSPLSGNKTENNLGTAQGWILKIDSAGNIIWDKTIFTNSLTAFDEAGYVIQSKDGGIVVANFTKANIGGYKTQASRGNYDYWIVKFKDTTACSAVSPGIIYTEHDTICAGTIADLAITGNAAHVQWQASTTTNNFKNISGDTVATIQELLSQTTYFRIIAGNGICTDTSVAFRLYVASFPQAIFTNADSGLIIKFNSSGSSGNVTAWHWDFGDGDTSNAANPVHVYNKADTFDVCLTVFNNSNCDFTTCQNVQVYYTGITEINPFAYWNAYPNPVEDRLVVDCERMGGQIEIKDLLGQSIYKKPVINAQTIINVSNFPQGVYFIFLNSEGHKPYAKKIIKE